MIEKKTENPSTSPCLKSKKPKRKTQRNSERAAQSLLSRQIRTQLDPEGVSKPIVRFLPEDNLQQQVTSSPTLPNETWMQLPADIQIQLKEKHAQFLAGDTVAGLEMYRICLETGLYPPPDILKAVGRGITTILDSQGTTSFEKAIGIVPCQGKKPPFLDTAEKQRDFMLCGHMYLLQKVLKLTLFEAAHMVFERFKESTWKDSRFPFTVLTSEDLQKKYGQSKWRVYRKLYHDHVLENFELKTKEQYADYLQDFPYDSLPAKIRQWHPKHGS